MTSAGSNGPVGADSELPTGWAWAAFDDLGTWTGGGTPKKSVADYWDGNLPWVSPKDMKNVRLTGTQDHITESALEESAAKVFPANSVAIVVRSGILEHTLPVALIPFRAAANQDMKILTPRPGVNPEWLLYALLGAAPDIREQCRKHGTTVASIDFARLRSYRIALPPRAEQDRIATEVRDCLGMVATGQRELEAAQSRFESLRSASLSALQYGRLRAYSGDVADDLRRARRSRLSELANIQYGWTAKPRAEKIGPKILRITDIQDGAVDWASIPHCEIPVERHEAFRLKPGDIVFARSGATTGKSYLIGTDVPDGAVFASYLIRVQPKDDLLPEFLALFFQSSDFWAHIRTQSRGMAQPNVNGSVLGELEVPVPGRPAQEAVLRAAWRSLRVIGELGRQVASEHWRAMVLQQAVLRTATRTQQ